MKLFTKSIDKQLFEQYSKGSDLENQKVVAKIFNPYGRGVWYIMNSDPTDPDYLWAIVDLFEPEMGSVSREELETLRVPPFGLGLERDLYFDPKPAKEVWNALMRGERFEKGGSIAMQNKDMLENQTANIMHHAEELHEAVKKTNIEIMPWVLTKLQRATTDLQDITHYLDGEEAKFAHGGMVVGRWYKDNSGKEFRYIGESQGKLLFNDGEKIVEKDEDDFEEEPKREKLFGFFEEGGFIEKTDEELKGMNDDELFAYLDAKAAYMKQYARPLSSNKAKNYAANATAIQFQKEGTDTISKNLPNFSKINEQATKDYQETLAKKLKNKMAMGGELGSEPKVDDIVDFGEGLERITRIVKTPKGDEFIEAVAIDGSSDRRNLYPKNEWAEVLKNQEQYKKATQERQADQEEGDKLRKEKEDLEKEITKEYNDIDGFGENLTPMQKGKALQFLNKKVWVKDGQKVRQVVVKNELRKYAKKDWYVKPLNGVDKIRYKEDDNTFIIPEYLQKKISIEYLQYLKEKNKMAMGGKVKFTDKVKAIKASLLKRKKVSPKVQKDYGKTYSPKEAEESAKRIVGSMVKKEKMRK